MLNEVVLIGRLGKDPEITYTGKGTKIATISLPLYHNYQRDDMKTQWVRCEAWAKLANIVELAKKGVLVAVQGELHIESWQDENKEWKSRTYIRIDSFRFLEKRKNEPLLEDNSETPSESISILEIEGPNEMTVSNEDVEKFFNGNP